MSEQTAFSSKRFCRQRCWEPGGRRGQLLCRSVPLLRVTELPRQPPHTQPSSWAAARSLGPGRGQDPDLFLELFSVKARNSYREKTCALKRSFIAISCCYVWLSLEQPGPGGCLSPPEGKDVNSEACFDLRKKSLAAVRTERSSGHAPTAFPQPPVWARWCQACCSETRHSREQAASEEMLSAVPWSLWGFADSSCHICCLLFSLLPLQMHFPHTSSAKPLLPSSGLREQKWRRWENAEIMEIGQRLPGLPVSQNRLLRWVSIKLFKP